MKLTRPYIPVSVRIAVAERQCFGANIQTDVDLSGLSAGAKLKERLRLLFGDKKAELHHRPALVNRRRRKNGEYDPPANSPDYLVYLADDDHDVETRIRGLHGSHSDLGMARKNKNIAKNRDPKRRKAKIAQPKNFRWPSRPFNRRKK